MCTQSSQRNMQHKKGRAHRLHDAIKTKDMGEMTVVQRHLDVAYPNMEAFKKEINWLLTLNRKR